MPPLRISGDGCWDYLPLSLSPRIHARDSVPDLALRNNIFIPHTPPPTTVFSSCYSKTNLSCSGLKTVRKVTTTAFSLCKSLARADRDTPFYAERRYYLQTYYNVINGRVAFTLYPRKLPPGTYLAEAPESLIIRALHRIHISMKGVTLESMICGLFESLNLQEGCF